MWTLCFFVFEVPGNDYSLSSVGRAALVSENWTMIRAWIKDSLQKNKKSCFCFHLTVDIAILLLALSQPQRSPLWGVCRHSAEIHINPQSSAATGSEWQSLFKPIHVKGTSATLPVTVFRVRELSLILYFELSKAQVNVGVFINQSEFKSISLLSCLFSISYVSFVTPEHIV